MLSNCSQWPTKEGTSALNCLELCIYDLFVLELFSSLCQSSIIKQYPVVTRIVILTKHQDSKEYTASWVLTTRVSEPQKDNKCLNQIKRSAYPWLLLGFSASGLLMRESECRDRWQRVTCCLTLGLLASAWARACWEAVKSSLVMWTLSLPLINLTQPLCALIF